VSLQPKSGQGHFEISRQHTISTHHVRRLYMVISSYRGRYLHNKYKPRTSMPSAKFEPAVSTTNRPWTHAL